MKAFQQNLQKLEAADTQVLGVRSVDAAAVDFVRVWGYPPLRESLSVAFKFGAQGFGGPDDVRLVLPGVLAERPY